MGPASARAAGLVVGRYALYDEIAAGGMASVHIGRLLGPARFSRTVAVKRLHAAYAKDPPFLAMFLDEAHLAARIRHPNVVSTLDVANAGGELFLVMDYIHGASLSALLRVVAERGETVPVAVSVAIVIGLLHGLDAAHEATGERGEPLGIVHRDVSPHNILVGVDGVARVADFGIAKAMARLQTTADGQIKGKLAYMSPEQLRQGHVDRRADVFAASIVLWELLAGRRLFAADDPAAIGLSVLEAEIVPPSRWNTDLPAAVDAVVLRGLAREPGERFATARDLLLALEGVTAPASQAVVGDWVKRCVGDELEQRRLRIREVEESSLDSESATAKPTGGGLEQVETMRRRATTLTAPVEVEGAVRSGETHALGVEETGALPVAKRDGQRRRFAMRLLAIVVVVLGSAAYVALRARSATPMHASAITATTSAVAAPPSIAPEAPTTTAPPEATASARATSAPISSATTRAATPAEAPRRRLRPPVSCDPPYVWDSARQIRVYKKECR